MDKIKFEPVSHYRQLHDPSCKTSPTFNKPINEQVFKTVQIEDNGVIKNKQVLAEVTLRDRYKGMKCSDYALQNLIECGAIDTLRPIVISGNANVEQVENSISSLESAIAAAEKQSQTESSNSNGNAE